MITPTTGEEQDWAKERQVEELRVEEFERRVIRETRRPLYFRENTRQEFLAEVERENVESSRKENN